MEEVVFDFKVRRPLLLLLICGLESLPQTSVF